MSHTIIPREEEDHLPKPDEIQKTLTWSFTPGETFEIRALESQTNGRVRTSSGYFRDVKTAVQAVLDYIEQYQPKQVYCTLNPTRPDVYARVRDHIQANVKNTTQDKEIARIRAILIDCDPVRPAGIPSSETELQATEEKMRQVKEWLDQRGFPAPLIGLSSNGYHLRYAVDLAVADSTLVKEFLVALAHRFDDAQVKIDRTVFNPSRIAKLYGTFSRKGDDVPEDGRFNRMSRLLECPTRQEVTREQIQAVIDELRPTTINNNKAAVTPAPQSCTDNRGPGKVDVSRFLERRGIGYRDEGNGKYILSQCAFDPSHNRGEVAVFQKPSGSLAYHCFHNSCAEKGWRDFTAVVGRVEKEDFCDDGLCQTATLGPQGGAVVPVQAASVITFNAKPASLLAPNEALDWVWRGYIPRGHITLLTALWKAGKSTLLGHLIEQMQRDGTSKPLGQIAKGKALVVSEESEVEWKTRCVALKLSDEHRFLCRPFAGKPSMSDYSALIDFLAEQVKAGEYALVVLDTLGHFLPVDDENDAAKMMRALIPLNRITDAGAGLLINHHPRKSQGEEGLSTRGSGALAGFASILMELRRYDASNEQDCRRKLKVLSRHQTPPEAVLELKGSEYSVVGSLSDSKAQERYARILGLLPKEPPGMTVGEIHDHWADESPPARRTLQADLASMLDLKQVEKTGSGVKGEPFRFYSRTYCR